MSVYFVDTSAFAKRYLPEIGSSWVKSWIVPSAGHSIVISELSTLEFTSILARHQRDGLITARQFKQLQQEFLRHARQEYQILRLRTRRFSGAKNSRYTSNFRQWRYTLIKQCIKYRLAN